MSAMIATTNADRTLLGGMLKEAALSEVVRRALGDHVFECLIEAQRSEWNAFRKHVSGWERDRYLEVY